MQAYTEEKSVTGHQKCPHLYLIKMIIANIYGAFTVCCTLS